MPFSKLYPSGRHVEGCGACRGDVEGLYNRISLQLSLQLWRRCEHRWGRTDSLALRLIGSLVVSDTPMTVPEHVGGQLTSVVAQKWSGCIVRVVGEARIPAVWLYSLYSNLYILYNPIHAPHPSTCPSQRLYSSTAFYSSTALHPSTLYIPLQSTSADILQKVASVVKSS